LRPQSGLIAPDQPPTRVPSLSFGGRRLGSFEPVVVIAEIGINHEGNPEQCARMIEAAAKAGADAIKLQVIDADENYVRGTESHTLFSSAGLSRDQVASMFALARRLGVEVLATAGDFSTLDWIEQLNPAAYKISSGLLTNHPLVRHATSKGRTILMSTGMAGQTEIDAAVAVVSEAAGGVDRLALFQCTSIYPAPRESLNLRTIGALTSRYRVPVGFSDHSRGIEAAILSVAAGACMVEKHFSLDVSRPGFDHLLSLEPDDFAAMIAAIRRAETMLGRPEKTLDPEEAANARRFHRILVARVDINPGELLTPENVGLKRPLPEQKGLHPSYYEDLMGCMVVRHLKRDDSLTFDAVE